MLIPGFPVFYSVRCNKRTQPDLSTLFPPFHVQGVLQSPMEPLPYPPAYWHGNGEDRGFE